MKRFHITMFLALLLAPLLLVSCSENDTQEEEFPNWQEQNDAYFRNIYNKAMTNTDGSWKIIKSYAYEDTVPHDITANIVVEVLKEGTASGSPLFTDSVKVNYRGRLSPSASYPEGYVFDSSYQGDYDVTTARPVTFCVGALVDGFATALQHMHIGDQWRVYIPYQLGYGSSEKTGIPAFSTLVFDIALVNYFKAGDSPSYIVSERE